MGIFGRDGLARGGQIDQGDEVRRDNASQVMQNWQRRTSTHEGHSSTLHRTGHMIQAMDNEGMQNSVLSSMHQPPPSLLSHKSSMRS